MVEEMPTDQEALASFFLGALRIALGEDVMDCVQKAQGED